MSSYSYTCKLSFKKVMLFSVLIFIVLEAIFIGVNLFMYNADEHKISFGADIDSVTYNENANTSSFEVEVSTFFMHVSVLTARDVNYKLTFQNADGEVVAEHVATWRGV